MERDDTSRCAVCGWSIYASRAEGCVRGDCSWRPLPKRLYAPDRAVSEYGLRFFPWGRFENEPKRPETQETGGEQ